MFHHITVLQQESVEGLQVKSDGIYVDCTLGGAGHSFLIAEKLGEGGRLIGIDQDDMALQSARERLSPYMDHVTLVKSNFRHLKKIVEELALPYVDGILFDLGVSSPQLDQADRGFSYQADAPLDMRMDREQPLSAYHVVNEWPEEDLSRILYEYGEEKFSRRIAREIINYRTRRPVETTGELVEIIKKAIPAAARRTGPHPAKRSFQAIRIAVNDELNVFKEALKDGIDLLQPGGKICVITFHSLEDRICKQIFQEYSKGCTCPPGFPQCVCGNSPVIKVITRKPILPGDEELEMNPRARSAKLRIGEKL